MTDKYKMYIGREWVDAKGGKTFDDYNPATGELWAQIASADRADAKSAVEAAYDAQHSARRKEAQVSELGET